MPEKRLISKCTFLLLSLLFAADSSSAQRKITVLRGELQTESTAIRLSDYQVQLISTTSHFVTDRSQVSSDGTFYLRDAEPGIARLLVLDQRGEIVQEEYLTIHEGIALNVRLKTPEKAEAASGRVSVNELTHPVPEKALKEYAKAKKATSDGDLDKTIAHFRKAVEIYPRFFQAWNDLGVAYMKERHAEEAAGAFQKAAEIAPAEQRVQQNLKVALNYLQVLRARAALQQQP